MHPSGPRSEWVLARIASSETAPNFSLQKGQQFADTSSMEPTDSAHDIATEIAPEVDPADPVFAPLLARRVAIVGFGPAEEARLNALFSKAGASCHAFHWRALQLAVR